MTARIALTFDYYGSTYTNCLFDMNSKSIPGTIFVDPATVGTSGFWSRDNLILAQSLNWEVGAYPAANMVTLWNSNRDSAKDKLKSVLDAMGTLGFIPKSLAATQRSWSSLLAGISDDLYDNVRVCANVAWSAFPVSNRHYVNDGGTASWSSTDTVASLSAQLDAVIAAGELWIPVIHSCDTTGDPLYTVSPAVFQGFTSYLQTKVSAGLIKAMTFKDAIV